MPGAPTPSRMAIPQMLADMQRQIDALAKQQMQVVTDPTGATGDPAHSYATMVTGNLQPITGIAAYGIAVWSGTAWTQITSLGLSSFTPGDMKCAAYAGTPTGWLLCDGASVLRASYAALFAAIGTTWGSVDGTHFNLPDLRGRAPVGAGTGTATGATAHNLGSAPTSGAGGEETHILSVAEMPSHNHTGSTGTGTTGTGTTGSGQEQIRNYPAPGVGGATNALQYSGVATTTLSTQFSGGHTHSVPGLSVPALSISSQGSGNAHNTLSPIAAVNWFIKT